MLEVVLVRFIPATQTGERIDCLDLAGRLDPNGTPPIALGSLYRLADLVARFDLPAGRASDLGKQGESFALLILLIS